jgi:hypothetical protein
MDDTWRSRFRNQDIRWVGPWPAAPEQWRIGPAASAVLLKTSTQLEFVPVFKRGLGSYIIEGCRLLEEAT